MDGVFSCLSWDLIYRINCVLSRPLYKKTYLVKWLLKMEVSHTRIPGNEKT